MHPDHNTPAPRVITEVERWKPVPGWPDFDVSDWGRLRSYLLRGDHEWACRQRAAGLTPRILKPGITRSGHLRIRLTRWVAGIPERRMFGIHELVLMAFVGPCPPGMECCHGPDPTPANNRLDNLRWDTHAENMRDVVRHGKHSGAILDEPQVREIWAALVDGGETINSIARRYGVTRQAINGIKSGRSWSHITQHLPGRPAFYQWVAGEDVMAEARRLRAAGMMYKDIATACGIGRKAVRRILGRSRVVGARHLP